MAQLRTIDQRQRELDDNPQGRFQPTTAGTWGVQNAVLNRDERRADSVGAANENRPPQQRFANNSRSYTAPGQPAKENTAATQNPRL